MRIVARKTIWSATFHFAAVAVAFALMSTPSAWADGPNDERVASGGMESEMMMPSGPPVEHLAQMGQPHGGPGMGGRGGMGGGPGMGPGGMEAGMGMGMMGPGMGPGMGLGGIEGGMGMMGRTLSAEELSQLPLNDVLAIVLASKPSDKELPKIETLVERAMAIDPQVVAARAEVQRAQAELERIQLDVFRRVIETRARWQVAKQTVERLEAKVNQDRDNEELARAYISARARLALVERELPLLANSAGMVGGKATSAIFSVGVASDAGLAGVVTMKPGPGATATVSAVPQPPKEFDKPVSMDFGGAPLKAVVDTLQHSTGVQFVIDQDTSVGDIEVTLCLEDIPLGDALQAIEDTSYPVRFVIRPYGVLVTDADAAVNRFGEKPGSYRPQGTPSPFGATRPSYVRPSAVSRGSGKRIPAAGTAVFRKPTSPTPPTVPTSGKK